MNEIFNNPAGRLLIVFREGIKKPGGPETWKIWSELLKSDATNAHHLFQPLSKLNRALDELEQSINKHVPNPGLFLRYESAIRGIIAPKNLGEQWEASRVQIKPEILYSLEVCAAALAPHYPDKGFFEELPKIKQQLAAVMEEVNSTSLADGLKKLIIRRIEELLEAIQEFEDYGITEVDESIHAVIGVVGLATPEILENDPKNRKWLETLVKGLQKLEQGLHVGHAFAKLGERITKIISDGT